MFNSIIFNIKLSYKMQKLFFFYSKKGIYIYYSSLCTSQVKCSVVIKKIKKKLIVYLNGAEMPTESSDIK